MLQRSAVKRDDKWLLSRLDYLWTSYFPDVVQDNQVYIKFGRYSKYRLGSIKQSRKNRASLITITGMFKDESIPSSVVDHTIAHELVHYTHGFSSTKPKLHKYPHAGRVVDNEMKNRGLGVLVQSYKIWVKQYRDELTRDR